jgi:hypothetical protein
LLAPLALLLAIAALLILGSPRHPAPPAAPGPTVPVPSVRSDPFIRLGIVRAGPPGAADPSGIPMPLGNLPGWRQVFTDDFTTDVPLGRFSGCAWKTNLMDSECSGLPASVAAKWWAYPDGWPDTLHTGQYYPSRVLSIHNGEMDIYLHTSGGIHMVAAPVPKVPGGTDGIGMRYGAYVIRFRADPLYGYKTSWMLWPDRYVSDTYPSKGETDFPEGDLDLNINAFMHWMNASNPNQQYAYSSPRGYRDWHTATIEWTPSMCRFILDGKVIGTSTGHIPTDPMHWILQTETSTFPGRVPRDGEAGHVLIDWVVAYAYDPAAQGS